MRAIPHACDLIFVLLNFVFSDVLLSLDVLMPDGNLSIEIFLITLELLLEEELFGLYLQIEGVLYGLGLLLQPGPNLLWARLRDRRVTVLADEVRYDDVLFLLRLTNFTIDT